MNKRHPVTCITLIVMGTLLLSSCDRQKKQFGSSINTTDTSAATPTSYDPGIEDDYSKITDVEQYKKWGSHNLHDPAGIKVGDYYYLYSTDAIYWPQGAKTQSDSINQGNIHVRRSRDLVKWEFLGWAFDSIPAEAVRHVKEASGGQIPNGIWAPYIVKAGDQYRLYYSVSAFGANTSYIGMATSSSPEGPWTQAGGVVKTVKKDAMNAIDPTIVNDENNGKQWMIYGSYFGGIYCLEVNPATGLALKPGDHGKCVARRAEGKTYIIEAPEVIYNPQLKKYFLFVSYDALFTHYNIRVGRADKPEGPYYDLNGNDMAKEENNYPVLTYAYRFANHPGWAGVGHCGIIRNEDDYYMFHQGRLAPENLMIDLHVRKIFWTPDGWPVVSPERYVDVPQAAISEGDVVGQWEKIQLADIKDPVKLWQGQIPPGGWHYDTLQFNNSVPMHLVAGGKVQNAEGVSWKLNSTNLLFTDASGKTTTTIVSRGWDWENKKPTIVFTGIAASGFSVWGKKID